MLENVNDVFDKIQKPSSAEKRNRKLKKALVRFYKGNSQSGVYHFMTLTTPDDQDPKELNHHFRKLKLILSRADLRIDYFAVREWNKKHTCQHLHLVTRLDVPVCSKMICPWLNLLIRISWTFAIYKTYDCKKTPTGLIICKIIKQYGNKKGLANYLAKYLTKGIDKLEDEGVKFISKQRLYWISYGWILRGWICLEKLKFRCYYPQDLDMEYINKLKREEQLEAKRSLAYHIMSYYRHVKQRACCRFCKFEFSNGLAWSITLSKELRSLGIDIGTSKYEYVRA